MKKLTLALTATVLCALGATAVFAQQSQQPGVPMPIGVTMITLNVTEQEQVRQDVLVASVRYEARGKTAEAVQKEINDKMAKAIDLVKKEPAIKVSTESYSVYMNQNVEPVTDAKTGKTTNVTKTEWYGSQGMSLESKDAGKVQNVTGKLQAMGLAVNNLGYTLSPEKAEQVHEALMKGAVEKLKKQAANAASLLGKKNYNIAEISVDNSNMPRPMPMMAMMARADMAMEKAMPAPTAEVGESTVSMTLTARVELKD